MFSDYDEAELFVNGKSQGRIKKSTAKPGYKVGAEQYVPDLDRYRLRWMNVKYEPGELKVVAYDKDGREAMIETMRTAGEPDHLLLEADRSVITADGNDLCYITVSMVDKEGNLCPLADDQLLFEVEGDGAFKCVCNGDATSIEQFTEPTMRLFSGKLVVTVQSTTKAGTMTLKVRRPAASAQQKGKKNIVSAAVALESSIDIKTK